ncbi:indole-2-monooxygenase-like [Triticum dicoccoides]|uniref:indole-2-monooxygenase-like n=1 Tax=Triticum dicoccoides TaxID=85692 RepID=UPI0018905F55|nr:indole-2-monooxygenase-like [Triticum dicoccoides]
MAALLQQLMQATLPQPPLLLFFPLALVLLHYLVITGRSGRSSHCCRLPPSPPRLPVIGHLHLVGFLPHVNLRRLAMKYGPDYMLIQLGSVPTLVVSSPRAAQTVLRTHDHVFASRPTSTVADTLMTASLDVALAVYGDHWRQAKRLLSTHLLTVKKVSSYRPGREEEARLVVAKIAKATASHETMDMSDTIYSFTSDIVCRAVSGNLFKVDGRNRLLRELIEASGALIGGVNIEDFYPGLVRVGFIKRAVCARADKLKKRWDELLDKVVDDHQENTHEHGLTKDHIKAMLIDIFFGATDSTSMLIESVMAELIRNPQVMSKLQAELRSKIPEGKEIVTEDDLATMTYLKAVIKETFRLHPPAPLLGPHLSMDNVQIDGYIVPAHMPVLVNAWAIGRDPSTWEDPEKFMPERFLNVDIDYKGNNFELLPFGTGRRMCPAINFSMSTYELMLGNLLYHFDWELPGPRAAGGMGVDMTEVFRLTLHRKEKLLLIPRTRT